MRNHFNPFSLSLSALQFERLEEKVDGNLLCQMLSIIRPFDTVQSALVHLCHRLDAISITSHHNAPSRLIIINK